MTPRAERTVGGEATTELILSAFRLNGILLAAGDLLAAGEDLTAARWQVLGAISIAERPLTVPQIARRMGLTRQSVHATVKRLVDDGFLELVPNADHQRSQLVDVTEWGRAKYAALDKRQAAWVNGLASRIRRSDIDTATAVVKELCRRLEAEGGSDPRSA